MKKLAQTRAKKSEKRTSRLKSEAEVSSDAARLALLGTPLVMVLSASPAVCALRSLGLNALAQ